MYLGTGAGDGPAWLEHCEGGAERAQGQTTQALQGLGAVANVQKVVSRVGRV